VPSARSAGGAAEKAAAKACRPTPVGSTVVEHRQRVLVIPHRARESGSIDGTPVADADDLNDQAVVFDRVHHAILSYPYPIGH
jgi:hypothetical protein